MLACLRSGSLARAEGPSVSMVVGEAPSTGTFPLHVCHHPSHSPFQIHRTNSLLRRGHSDVRNAAPRLRVVPDSSMEGRSLDRSVVLRRVSRSFGRPSSGLSLPPLAPPYPTWPHWTAQPRIPSSGWSASAPAPAYPRISTADAPVPCQPGRISLPEHLVVSEGLSPSRSSEPVRDRSHADRTYGPPNIWGEGEDILSSSAQA